MNSKTKNRNNPILTDNERDVIAIIRLREMVNDIQKIRRGYIDGDVVQITIDDLMNYKSIGGFHKFDNNDASDEYCLLRIIESLNKIERELRKSFSIVRRYNTTIYVK